MESGNCIHIHKQMTDKFRLPVKCITYYAYLYKVGSMGSVGEQIKESTAQ